jgi:hypothetical protein
VRDFDGDSWSSILRVCVCVCVCVCVYVCMCVSVRVLGQQGRDSKFTVIHKYSDTLCNTNTPYCHGHGGMTYLTTTLPTVTTITTQQTAWYQVCIRQGYHRHRHISAIHTSFIIPYNLSFRCLRKIAKRYKFRHVCPSVRTEQLGSH